MLSGRVLIQNYFSQLIDLLLVLVTAWTALAMIFAVYAYWVGLRDPLSGSVFGRIVVISFFIITASIWVPVVAGTLFLSVIGNLCCSSRPKQQK